MTENINIEIMDQVLDPKFWRLWSETTHYSGHIYRNSPYESDDNCGTCDGARCDICKVITEPEHLELVIASDLLHKILIEHCNVPKDIADELAYGTSYNYKGYHLVWPTHKMLKKKYPEEYDIILSQAIKY